MASKLPTSIGVLTSGGDAQGMMAMPSMSLLVTRPEVLPLTSSTP